MESCIREIYDVTGTFSIDNMIKKSKWVAFSEEPRRGGALRRRRKGDRCGSKDELQDA